MKVAIIGAGISGLACAFELEKHHIYPDIFERCSSAGVASRYAALWPRIIIRTRREPFQYLEKKYGLILKPSFILSKDIMVSPNRQAVIQYDIGYIYLRGPEQESFDNQLLSKIKSPIHYSTHTDAAALKDQYDYIIVATGVPESAKKTNNWISNYRTLLRCCTVQGEFETGCVKMWLNEDYSKKSYCYLLAKSRTEATLSLIVNNANNNELESHWKHFWQKEGFDYPITNQYDLEYECGYPKKNQADNMLFIGNAGGFTEDLLGVGAFNGLESGILAARAITEHKDFDKLVEPIKKDLRKLHEIRKTFNHLVNKDFDYLIGKLQNPFVQRILYKNRICKLRMAYPFIKIYNALKKYNE